MYAKAELFISYSRLEPAQDASAPGHPDHAKWKSRKVALDLIGVLEEKLNEKFQVWRDEPCLSLGDDFASKLDAALLSCAGAVLMLDPAAVEVSSWVRWETSILTWRARLQSDVRIVPVLIDVQPEELKQQKFEPTRVEQLLGRKVDAQRLEPGSGDYQGKLEAIAEEIVEAFDGLEATPARGVGVWISRIAACFSDKTSLWRGELCQAFEPHPDRLNLAQEPRAVVARELVGADRERFARILHAIVQYPTTEEELRRLHVLLEPVWVPADVARTLAVVADLPDRQRVMVVNADDAKTGEHVVRRGRPEIASDQTLTVTPVGPTLDAAVADIREKVLDRWGNRKRDALETVGDSFVVIGGQGMPIEQLVELGRRCAHEFRELTFVLMTGSAVVTDVTALDPMLGHDADDDRLDFEYRLPKLMAVKAKDGEGS